MLEDETLVRTNSLVSAAVWHQKWPNGNEAGAWSIR